MVPCSRRICGPCYSDFAEPKIIPDAKAWMGKKDVTAYRGLGMGQKMETVEQVGPVAALQPPRGFSLIVEEAMSRSGVSVRQLASEKVIPISWRSGFLKRMDEGRVSLVAFQLLCDRLGLNVIRAMIAVHILHDPMSYFDQTCAATARYTEELGKALYERASALEGDFHPIKRNLCRSHVERISGDIMAHQDRVSRTMDADIFQVG